METCRIDPIYLSMHTATPSFLSITRRAALRWRKARTYLGIPGYACETTGSARRQPDHIHMDRLTHLQTENIPVLVRREPVPHWYAAQSQKTEALPLSHGGSPFRFLPAKQTHENCVNNGRLSKNLTAEKKRSFFPSFEKVLHFHVNLQLHLKDTSLRPFKSDHELDL